MLAAADPADKLALTAEAAAAWRAGDLPVGSATPPDRPARPTHPVLLPPRDMPRRRVTSGRPGRFALLHAVAHIELNAIDLAWDLIARFGQPDLPRAFFDDWVTVAADEAIHHGLLAERLAALDGRYGDLPAHDGLWQSAWDTRDDLLARLAIVPLVLEARGLDVTPAMIDRLGAVGDVESRAVLARIHTDEITHVAAGRRWFARIAADRGVDPVPAWQALVRERFRGRLKPPFNWASRAAAGFGPEFLEGLVV